MSDTDEARQEASQEEFRRTTEEERAQLQRMRQSEGSTHATSGLDMVIESVGAADGTGGGVRHATGMDLRADSVINATVNSLQMPGPLDVINSIGNGISDVVKSMVSGFGQAVHDTGESLVSPRTPPRAAAEKSNGYDR